MDLSSIVGSSDVLLITFDTLRYDVAEREFEAGRTPNLARLLPGGWERRHAPGSFTYAAHCAIFAGFFPTPAEPGKHQRLFALRFSQSETIGPRSHVFDAPDIVTGFANLGYRTICIGGVGFFKKENPLSRVLPDLFQESHWAARFGVTDADSTRHQVACAVERLRRFANRRVFLFLNISALHQPNCHHLPGATGDSLESHAAALRYVDSQLPPLFEAFQSRGDTLVLLMSDHGTTYGEDGYHGHRLAHKHVWEVPYAHTLLKGAS